MPGSIERRLLGAGSSHPFRIPRRIAVPIMAVDENSRVGARIIDDFSPDAVFILKRRKVLMC